MNARKSHKLYKRQTTSTVKNLTNNAAKHLYVKYFEDFNFYFAKSVNEILSNIHSSDELWFKDYVIYDSKEEIMRRYYNTQESDIRLSNYAAYYAELEDYLIPHHELHFQRKLLFKRRKRKYKLKSRQFELSRINPTPNRMKRRPGLLDRLDKKTMYLEDVNVSNTMTIVQNESSFKLDTNYRLEFIRGLEFNEVHDIYNPVFSSEDESSPVRPTVTTIAIDQEIGSSDIFNPVTNDSIITKLSELEKVNRSKIENARLSSDSINVQMVETLELLSPKPETCKYNISITGKHDFKKRKRGIEAEIKEEDCNIVSANKKIKARNHDIIIKPKNKSVRYKTKSKTSQKKPQELNLHSNGHIQFENHMAQNFLNFTSTSSKNINFNEPMFKTNDDNYRKNKNTQNKCDRNNGSVRKSKDRQNNVFIFNTITERESKSKASKEFTLHNKYNKNNYGISPVDSKTPIQYLNIQDKTDNKRKSSQKRISSGESMLKLNLKNKKLLLATKNNSNYNESKPTLSLSSYVKSLLQKNKKSSGSNTLTSFKKKDFISKLAELKKDSTISNGSKGIFSTFKESSLKREKNKGSVKRIVTSNSIQRLKGEEKILPERFYNKQYNRIPKKRNTSPNNQIDEYNYYQSVKRGTQKSPIPTKGAHKTVKAKGSCLPDRKNESKSNSRSISTQRLLKLAIKNISHKDKIA